MKAIFRFDLSNPDDWRDYHVFNQALEMAAVLRQLTHELRSEVKHGDQEHLNDSAYWKNRVWQLINDNNVTLD